MRTYEESRDELSLYLVGHGFDRSDEGDRLDYVEGRLIKVPVSVRFGGPSAYVGMADDDGAVGNGLASANTVIWQAMS